MRTYAAVVAMMMLAAAVSAQTTNVKYFADESLYGSLNVTRAERGYLTCLNIGNDGVVESALAQIAMMKLMKATDGSEAMRTKVAAIARTAASQELRYKAFLTKTVLEDPGMFDTIARTGYESADELFGAIASRMSEYYAAR